MPLTIIGASSLLPSRSLKLKTGKILLVIDKPIITCNVKEVEINRLVNQCRQIIIENKNKYENKFSPDIN